jgi:hypothetical protein
MSTMTQVLNPEMIRKDGYNEELNRYVVVHPLDDLPEEKVDIEALGPMPMTASVKWSLVTLRGYLLLMIALVFYRVLGLAGVFSAAR